MNPLKVLFDRDQIKKRVTELSREISEYYHDCREGGRLVLLCPLKGSFIFAADLVREMDNFPMSIEFIHASSYQGGEKSSPVDVGNVGRKLNLHDQSVLIVEDIIHTGRTVRAIKAHLRSDAGGAQVWNDLQVCTLLCHTTRAAREADAKWVGFEITHPNTFVAGYGMDYKEHLRNYPDIVIID